MVGGLSTISKNWLVFHRDKSKMNNKIFVARNKKKVAVGLPKKLLEKLLATCGQGYNPVD